MNITKSAGLGLLAFILLTSTGALAGGVNIIMPSELSDYTEPKGGGGGGGDTNFKPPTTELPKKDGGTFDPSNPFPGVNQKPKIQLSGKSGEGARSSNDIKLAVACAIIGSPAELMVLNQSNFTLPEGTAIRWQVRQFGRKGYVALNASLSAGQGVTAKGLLEDGIVAGADCSAKIM